MRKNEVLLAVTIIVFIIGVSAISWSEIHEPKHVELTARIVEKDRLIWGFFGPASRVFLMDNGDLVEVSKADNRKYETGDTYTYCTCQVIRL